MSFGAIAALAALAAAGADPQAAPDYHLVDMVVAQVDATVITLSALVAETRLTLLRAGGPEVARAGYLSQPLLNTVLKGIVQRELLLQEVRRLKLRDVPEADVVKALAAIKDRFATPVDYDRFLDRAGFREPGREMMKGYDAPAPLVAVLVAELEAEQLVDLRIRRGAPVPDSEVKLCFEANRARFEGRALEDVKTIIAERIQGRDRERAYTVLLEQLGRRATVRYAEKFEPPPEGQLAEGPGVLACPERKAEALP